VSQSQRLQRGSARVSQLCPPAAPFLNSLWRYFRAHGYKWAGFTDPARSRSLVNERHSASARTAVGGDEHLILITCRCTCSRAAIDTKNSNCILRCGRRTGRTGLAFFASRTGWSRRPGFPLFAGWTCGACFSLRASGTFLGAARQAKAERKDQSKGFRPHVVPFNLGSVGLDRSTFHS
jgi:hypothetical protein